MSPQCQTISHSAYISEVSVSVCVWSLLCTLCKCGGKRVKSQICILKYTWAEHSGLTKKPAELSVLFALIKICCMLCKLCCKRRNTLSWSQAKDRGESRKTKSGSAVFSHVSNRVRVDEKQPSVRVFLWRGWINTTIQRETWIHWKSDKRRWTKKKEINRFHSWHT